MKKIYKDTQWCEVPDSVPFYSSLSFSFQTAIRSCSLGTKVWNTYPPKHLQYHRPASPIHQSDHEFLPHCSHSFPKTNLLPHGYGLTYISIIAFTNLLPHDYDLTYIPIIAFTKLRHTGPCHELIQHLFLCMQRLLRCKQSARFVQSSSMLPQLGPVGHPQLLIVPSIKEFPRTKSSWVGGRPLIVGTSPTCIHMQCSIAKYDVVFPAARLVTFSHFHKALIISQ